MVNIQSVATALPDLELNQAQALEFILERFPMRAATRALYQKVFKNESVQTRRFSLAKLAEVLEKDPDKINRRFEVESVKLSAQALNEALRQAGARAQDLDFLAVSTCTGYLCPGISTRLIEACGLRPDLRCLDVVGMGCGSAIPALEQAHNFLKANPSATAASISTEVCSAAMVCGDSADLVVSNALFADGSACVLLKQGAQRGVAALRGFASLSHPQWKDSLRFVTENGRLRNVLRKDVPEKAALSVRPLIREFLKRHGLSLGDIAHWMLHSGGAKVMDAIQKALEIRDENMASSRDVLRRHGNLSSPTVMFGLKEILGGARAPLRGEYGLMVSFGAGFSSYACLLEF